MFWVSLSRKIKDILDRILQCNISKYYEYIVVLKEDLRH